MAYESASVWRAIHEARAAHWRAAVLVMVLCCLVSDSGAQVFRSGIDLRVIDVVVTGADGRPVTGLGAGDFEVTEDGEVRPVKFVTAVSVPEGPPTAPGPAVPSDVWTNASVESRRIFAIVLDDLSTRASDSARARAVVRRFIDRVPDGDLVSVVFTGQQTGAQEFTADKARLARNLEQYMGRNPLPDLDLVSGDGDVSDITTALRGTLQGEVAQNLSRMLETLVNVTDWLSTIEDRRKTILFVTAGMAPDLALAFLGGLEKPDPRAGASEATEPETGLREGASGASGQFSRLIARAAQANVAIYPLDYQGLAAPLTRELSRNISSLNPLTMMAGETGGVAAVNTNSFDGLFDAMIRDASEYYLVGYEPAVDRRDAKKARTHRIGVRVRGAGRTARSRTSYVTAPVRAAPDKDRTATYLLSNPLPGGALDVRLQAAVFPKGDNTGQLVAVLEVAGDELSVDRRGRQPTVSLTYQFAATDVYGKAQAFDAREVTLRLSDSRLQQIGDSGVRLVGQLKLPPGSYRLRAGVVNQGLHAVVAGDVDVPDYKKRQIRASSVLLASTTSGKIPVRREDYAPFENRLPGVPTTGRSFGSQERLDAYLEVHTGEKEKDAARLPEAVQVTALLHDAARPAAPAVPVPVTVGAREKGIGGGRVYPVHAALAMAGLPEGDYVLEFSVASESTTPLHPRVAFTVR